MIDTATNMVIDTIPVGNSPVGVDIADIMIIRNVPTLSEWGLIAMGGILGLAGYIFIRKRQAVV